MSIPEIASPPNTAERSFTSFHSDSARQPNGSPQYMDNVMSRFGHHLSPSQVRSISINMSSVKSSNSGGVAFLSTKETSYIDCPSSHFQSGRIAHGNAVFNIAKS
ncbi:hypothetical protein NQZ79_g8566 [Umbelopsis isabellina]|nr:hypothetical protein NQZ79_g8566 [Umbelopsis isabellina]